MSISQLYDSYSADFQKRLGEDRQLQRGRELVVGGLLGSSTSFAIASLFRCVGRSLFFVASDSETAGYLYHDLVQLLGERTIQFFPSSYKRAVKYGQVDPANVLLRSEVQSIILKEDASWIVVTSPEAIVEKVISSEEFNDNTFEVKVGDLLSISSVADRLYEYGFERVDYVYEPGQYAVRGSLIDLFSYSNEYPFRIDFFGDEIDSIRTFEVESQLSKERLDRMQILPNLNQYETSGGTIMEFIPQQTLVAYADLGWIKERTAQIIAEGVAFQAIQSEEYDEDLKKKLVQPELLIKQILDFGRVKISPSQTLPKKGDIFYSTALQPLFHKNFDLLSDTLIDFINKGYGLYLFSDSNKQLERLKGIFQNRGELIQFNPIQQAIHEGFVDHDLKICCFTDHQIFDRFHKFNLKSDRARTGKIALSLKELKQFEIGDYVVHINHGIGKFGGLVRTDINGKMQELVKIIYQNDDLVFVSIHSLHRLSKYKGKEGTPPKISRLGSGSWERIKEKTKSKVKDIARDLIKLYAERRSQSGFSYTKDSYLQQELEASFLYEDTPDQLKTTSDIKRDMESSRPMDRLVCGDVGFGKTEVAVRAAFKAVADSKQVAVMVPTTVLAFQHYKTFSSRLKDFPCRVEYLSRARSTKSVKAVLSDLYNGKVDILIGTHKLISADVKFKDLGLLIIDEEQKFGVSVKEKLRQMKTNVDTLTLTATPIPRTLQFSLMGARDLSVIQTPPPNRYPIQTEVHPFNDEILKEAINFELSRNGQVFIINNRIHNIGEIASLVNRLVPDARVAIGHGQMEPSALEQVILDFQNYEADVLIATTIIESGIDIPNANTIIVYNAQNFGLSELHQLRGRVGRSNRKAFCYLFAPPLSLLSQEARRRLQAIENFSELGSGIHIAMQDLDIRGAGNMLGAEQSGFIADLGYETYQKILQEAVTELRNEEFADLYKDQEQEEVEQQGAEHEFVSDCMVESDLELLFPSDYIPNDSERMLIYRELDSIERESDLNRYIEQIVDRFGKIPYQGEELIRVVRLRSEAKQLGCEKVVLKNDRMSLHLVSNADSLYYQSELFDRLLRFVTHNPRRCELKERDHKRIVVIKNVKSVETALQLFARIRGSFEEYPR